MITPPCPHCGEPVHIEPVDFAPRSMSWAVVCECQEDAQRLCYGESPEAAIAEIVEYAEGLEVIAEYRRRAAEAPR